MKATYNELDVLFLIPCNLHRVSILPGISLRGRGTHAIVTLANNCVTKIFIVLLICDWHVTILVHVY